MTSRDTLPSGKIAALEKEMIAGFPGSSGKQEDV